jgi:threonine/homoserine/homoserine lactone efflux protein
VSPGLLAASTLAGAAYTLTPGPGFLALLGIAAAQGRRAGAGFILGHFAGDVLWSTLALLAIVGARSVGGRVFDLLGLVCGAYLGWLGFRTLRATPASEGGVSTAARRPLLRGLAFGLTNPKAYPVALATFTALLGAEAASLAWPALPPLLGAACAGFLAADVLLVTLAGAATVRRAYRRHERMILRLSGVVFLAFAAAALRNAAIGLGLG